MRITSRKEITAPIDLVNDTAVLLNRVGVCNIDYFELSDVVHRIKASSLIEIASELFLARKQQGLISFAKLMQEARKCPQN
jgi:hypothetical protein